MINKGPKIILITGAGGYVGAMLADQFSLSPDLEKIIAIDIKPMPELLRGNKKVIWITADLSGKGWQGIATQHRPEVIIHCAWQIKELYGQKDYQRKLNIEGSKNVFEFVFKQPTVRKLIYFSTVASYGAFPENSLNRLFIEEDPLRENEYLYGIEKKEAEYMLKKAYEVSDKTKQVFVLRPSSITGPRGRYMVGKKGLLYMLKNVLPFVPVAGPEWSRQYIHEDDVTDIVGLLTFNIIDGGRGYEIFNISPGDIVKAGDMGRVFRKRVLRVPPVLVRAAFYLAWHLTRGKIPTGYGGWKFLTYPLAVLGSKITQKYGFEYSYSSIESLEKNEGRYEYCLFKKTL